MADDGEGGDPVCWLHRLCPECAAVPSDDTADRCWRCGAELPDGEPEDHAT